jgi:hypothetical protein
MVDIVDNFLVFKYPAEDMRRVKYTISRMKNRTDKFANIPYPGATLPEIIFVLFFMQVYNKVPKMANRRRNGPIEVKIEAILDIEFADVVVLRVDK